MKPYNDKTFYHFKTFYHPYLCEFIKNLNINGIDGFYQNANQTRLPNEYFKQAYNPTSLVLKPYPKEEIDFAYSGTYAQYNWELFYHIPLYIATRLSQNQKFAEARKWFHYIFDPTQTDNGQGAARFWKTKPFIEETNNGIASIDAILNSPDIAIQLDNWERNPFNPHAVARLRHAAYMRTTVMKYIDNLLAWGDQLFARDSIESINEATLLYILAANILGKKPQNIPARAKPVEQSFADLMDNVDENSINPMVEIEAWLSPSAANIENTDHPIPIPFFCIPKNQELLKYWDTVADRLFKIRNCMNIQGVVRQLPLFEPPIDPALLVRATAAGLDLNSILNDINVSLPHYRFSFMLQKANEFCNDVKNLGSQLLSVLEKKDAEALSLLRSNQELKVLNLILDIREQQKEEAKMQLDGLRASRKVMEERKNYYESREFMNVAEALHFASVNLGLILQAAQAGSEVVATSAYVAPDSKVGGPFTAGLIYGGTNYGNVASANARNLGTAASINNIAGNLASILGNYQRRQDDWKFQAKTANLELRQIDKQITAAEIRLAIAEKEVAQQQAQIENNQEIEDYLRQKFTNEVLYDYMIGQVSSLFFQCYQMAYDLAKKAEKCFQVELGVPDSNYIKFGYWDSLKKGLLSGEKLQLDLRRLELAYLEDNQRELELTKNISIALIKPAALLELKATGKCRISLHEELFDLDFSGHYFRRIKAVSLSIPCIAGPYTTVNCTLRLIKNSIRINTSLNGAYQHANDNGVLIEDDRFRSNNVPVTSIATSSGQNDTGMFEFNFRDERYLPFERAGAISEWELELPDTFRQFDYETISDIILHLRYTAREGGSQGFKDAAIQHLTTQIENTGLFRLFSLRHDFPMEWHNFEKATDNSNFKAVIKKEYFNYLSQTKTISKVQIQLWSMETGTFIDNGIVTNGEELNTVLTKLTDDLNDVTKEHQATIELNAASLNKTDNIFMILTYHLI